MTNNTNNESAKEQLTRVLAELSLKSDVDLNPLNELSDNELLFALGELNKDDADLTEKGFRKVMRLARGRTKYFNFLQRHGGWVTRMEYAKLIGADIKTLDSMIEAMEVITVQVAGEVCVPVFQYDETRGGALYGLGCINKELLGRANLGGSGAVTWWLSGANPRRDTLLNADDLVTTSEFLLSKARLAGEMGQ